MPVLLKNFPQVTFEKGVLTSPKEPVSLFIPQTEYKILFDSTAKVPPSLTEFANKKILAFITGKTLYVPGANNLQQQDLPESLSVTTTPDFLTEIQPQLLSMLRIIGFVLSLLFIPITLFFNFCLAGAVGLFFKLLNRRDVPRSIVFRWAFFLLGPLSALGFVNLWWPIPLFSFAQIILCIIYMQQIFNTIPEEK